MTDVSSGGYAEKIACMFISMYLARNGEPPYDVLFNKGVECYPLFAAEFPDCLFIPRPLPEFRMGEPGRFGITP